MTTRKRITGGLFGAALLAANGVLPAVHYGLLVLPTCEHADHSHGHGVPADPQRHDCPICRELIRTTSALNPAPPALLPTLEVRALRVAADYVTPPPPAFHLPIAPRAPPRC